MKHFTKLFVGILFLILGGTQSGMAQSIDRNLLLPKAVTPEDAVENGYDVFLYNVDEQKFVHGGGNYGMQAVLSDRGIRFTVSRSSDGGYFLKSAIVNKSKGSFVGIDTQGGEEGWDVTAHKVYVDRPDDMWANIHFNKTGNNYQKYNVYQLSTEISGWGVGDGTYKYHYDNNGDKNDSYVHAGRNNEADNWCLIKRVDYNTILTDVAKQGHYNVTGLIGNSRFLRNVSDKENKFWSVTNLSYDHSDYCTSIDPNLGTIQDGVTIADGYAEKYGAFGCVEIGAVNVDNGPVEFYQTIGGLKPGLYKVEAQAFFDKNDHATYEGGAYNQDNTTKEGSNAYLFANGEETLIPVLNTEDQKTFEEDITIFKSALKYTEGRNEYDFQKYFRRNVAAAYFLAQGDAFEPEESYHRVTVYVNVTDDGKGTGTLRLGVNKKGTKGRVYVDNFALTFIGVNEIGLDAYQRDPNLVDKNTYEQQYSFHLSRKFVLSENDKWNWNAITLPCDVYASQIKETFGEDAKLCKLNGVNPNNEYQILFTPVDLSNDYNLAIERGKCYLICVTAEPSTAAGNSFEFTAINETDETETKMVFPYGNIYTINGVSCPEGMITPEEGITVEADNNSVTTGKLSYTYFYQRPEKTSAGSYIMSGGKMYHLTSDWDGLLGTCWYITETSGKSMVMAIEGEGGTTDINGIVTEVPGDKAMEGVYNINGQKVADGTSLEGLPKGIYIVNGKKHVVK